MNDLSYLDYKKGIEAQDGALVEDFLSRLPKDTDERLAAVGNRITAFGQARMAKAIGVHKESVHHWTWKGVPPARVPIVAHLLGCSYSVVRPDIFPVGK